MNKIKLITVVILILFIRISFAQYISPVNDNPCNAVKLTVSKNTVFSEFTTSTSANPTIASPKNNRGYNGGDVWFTTTVPSTGLLNIEFQSLTQTKGGIAVYKGTDCHNLMEVKSDVSFKKMPGIRLNKKDNLADETIWIRFWMPMNDQPGVFKISTVEPSPESVEEVMSFGITDTLTPYELIQTLITGCMQFSNVTFTGDPLAIGYFTSASPPLNFNDGVLLTSGYATNAIGPNNSGSSTGSLTGSEGDPDLANLIGEPTSNIHDASIIEFDFIPSSDSIGFQYVFGSEEYPEFVNSSFNDVFGFFLSQVDPPPGGPYTYTNIALIPGTSTPVSINNVNNGTTDCSMGGPNGPCMNCAYYYNNCNGQELQYDGLTTTLIAHAVVQACHQYHIKLAVADVADHAFDSGVFLRAGSFSSGVSVSMQNHSMVGGIHDLYEGCTDHYVFARQDSSDLSDTIHVNLLITGTASIGADIVPFSTQINILPGQIYDTLYYSAILDDMPEGIETIIFSIANGCQCNQTLISDTIFVYDNWHLNAGIDNNATICLGDSITINTQVNAGFAGNPTFLAYHWSSGQTTSSVSVSPPSTTTYFVTINDPCTQDTVLQITITVVPAINPAFHSNKDSVCIGEHAVITFDGSAGPAASYTWNFANAMVFSGAGTGPYELSWGTEGDKVIQLQISDNGCIQSRTDTVHVNPIPSATTSFTDVVCYGACDGTATVVFDSVTTTHFPFTYEWDDPAHQATITAGSLCPGTYNVTFTNVSGCKNSQAVTIDQPSPLSAYVSGVDVLCFNGNEGSATLAVSNGTPQYTFLWSNGAVTQNLTNIQAGDYSVVVTDANGCTVSLSVTIHQPATPLTTSITTHNITCHGSMDGTATVGNSGGTFPYIYHWSDPAHQATPTAYNLSPGTYYVTVTDGNNCIVIDTAVISEPPQINISTATTPATCFGSADGTATVTVSGGVPPFNIAWSNGATTAINNNLLAGNYSVTISDYNYCIFSADVSVGQPTKIQVSTSGDAWICISKSTDVTAIAFGGTPGYSYSWWGSDTTLYTGSSINVNPLHTTTYFVSVTDQAGCHSGIYHVVVNVYPPLSLTLYTLQDTVCPGDPAEIRGVMAGGDGGPYDLTLNNDTMVTTPFLVYPAASQSYIVTMGDRCGSPVVSDTLMIKVLPEPPNNPEADKYEGCVPLLLSFTESSLNEGQTYAWNFGDHGYSQAKNPTHTYINPGAYTVSLTVTSAQGCKKTTVFITPVNAYPLPDARFNPNPEVVSVIKPEIQFMNISTDMTSAFWDFGDGDSSLSLHNPIHIFPARVGIYNVKLVVESSHGCRDTLVVPIKVQDEFTFYAPTAFTPDGDSHNEGFKPFGSGIDPNGYLFIVYDRWGQILFKTNDVNKAWDGKDLKGKKVKVGVYTWMVEYKDLIGNGHTHAGTVTLIR